MLFLIIVFHSLSLGYYHGCLGPIGMLLNINGKEPAFKWMPQARPYFGAQCIDGYRVLSYNDLIQFENQLPSPNFFNVPTWINAMAEYTPWMIYRGTYIILEDDIIMNTALHHNLQFTNCVRFCSAYDGYVYIGLQENGCFCLSSKALEQGSLVLVSQHNYMPCGKIAQCVKKSNEKSMTIYERDKSKIYGHAIGECLTTRIYRASVSIQPKSCSEKKQFILCQDENSGLRWSTNPESRDIIHSYCSHNKLSVPDYTAINSTRFSKILQKQGNYWLSNFRQQYFSTSITDNNMSPTYCVTGSVKDNRIELQITNCSKNNYVVCVKKTGVRPTSTTTSPVNPTHYIMKSSTEEQHNTSVNGLDATSNTDEFPLLPVILAAIGGLVTVLMVSVVVIVIVKVIKKRQTNRRTIEGPMYAVIQKNKTVNQPSSSNLSTKSQHDHKHDTEDVDSMYNEAIFTVSTSLPQQNISNYDTMENILDNGESVYHHATFYKSPQITPSFDVGESVYDHATTCGNDQDHNEGEAE